MSTTKIAAHGPAVELAGSQPRIPANRLRDAAAGAGRRTSQHLRPVRFLLFALVLLLNASAVLPAAGRKDAPAAALWITGEVFAENGTLLLRAERPVRNNPAGKVILLGATRDTVKVLLPVYAAAAEKHTRLRLYGVLQPFAGTVPAHPRPWPNVQFIAWKVHLPTDPDELPAGQKIILRPGDEIEGRKVEVPPRRP